MTPEQENRLRQDPDISFAPWTDEQVAKLNRYQLSNHFHPFTCANHHEYSEILIADNPGWYCPLCDYKQKWCHKFMVEYTEEIEQIRNKQIAKIFGK